MMYEFIQSKIIFHVDVSWKSGVISRKKNLSRVDDDKINKNIIRNDLQKIVIH